jgi:predicted DNA-binding transcriptional regulator AlpA
MSEPLLSALDVAARLSVCTRTVWRKVARGELPPPIHLGPKLRRWHARDVAQYLRRLRRAAEEG